MISLRSGTSGYAGCGGDRDRRRGRADRHRQIGSRDFLTQQRRVALQRLVDLRVWHPHPPGEERVVAVVEGEPLGGDRAQLFDRGRAEDCLVRIDPRGRGRQPGDLLRHLGNCRGGTLRIHVLDADARFHQPHDRRCERRHVQHLCEGFRIFVQLRGVAGDRG